MKFSFNLIKKLAPGKYDKALLVEKLNLHSFEAVDAGGDVLEVSVPPNRFSDAASHLGLAREASVIFGVKLDDPAAQAIKFDHKDQGIFRVNIKDKDLCKRYLAAYAAEVKVGPSPEWMKNVLETCGLRPINNVVDIMNYVMLETGQPLHAFDADKVSGGLVARRAKNKESIITIDNQDFELDNNILVIADAKNVLAIAGIKGGKLSEISAKTKRILVEAANFDGTAIYKASAALKLKTDASVRFSHNLSPELARIGMFRTLSLLKELAGAEIHPPVDVYPKKQKSDILRIDADEINNLIGAEFKIKEIAAILEKLGFKKKAAGKFETPLIRPDIENIEDVAEEVARFEGFNNLKPVAPSVALGVAQEEEIILLKDRIRNVAVSAGFDEIYSYSLVSEEETKTAPAEIFGVSDAVELANPMSGQAAVLRNNLASGLAKALKENLRFFEEVKIFEIGRIFGKTKNGVKETNILGVALSGKNAVLELKGFIDYLFRKLGIVDYFLPELNLKNKLVKLNESLRIETGDHHVLGYLGTLEGMRGAVLEIDLEKLLKAVDEEKEYEPLSKYPSIIRDISILVDDSARVGDILDLIQRVSPKWVDDVDLIDWYQDEKLGENKKSLTFRIVFQADDRTLTDSEVDKEMAAINKAIIEKFDAELR